MTSRCLVENKKISGDLPSFLIFLRLRSLLASPRHPSELGGLQPYPLLALADLVFYSWFDHPRRVVIIPAFPTVSRLSKLVDKQSG